VVLDHSLVTVAERRHRNDLGEIVKFLEPHREFDRARPAATPAKA
jgi:hypothetical protein